MRRPAFYALAFFVCGIVLGDSFDLPITLLSSVSALALAFCLVFLLRKQTGDATFFLILALVSAGFARHELLTRDFPRNHVSNYLNLGSSVTIFGRIADEPDVREDKTFVILEVETISERGRTYPVLGRIILKIKESTFKFDYADDVKLTGFLSQPTSARNPGAFDYRRYLGRKRIFGIVNLAHAEEVEILKSTEESDYWSGVVIPLRRWIQSVFDRTLSGDHKALLSGFLLGETREISKRVYTMFRDTGTVHLLAVSGSNVWLVVAVILGALTLFRVPKVVRIGLSLACIAIFANLVHNDPPVVRAGIMAAVVLLGTLLYKDVDLVNVVSFAGLMILFVSPVFLFDVGFQLSFASVFGILLLYPHLRKLVSTWVGRSHMKLWKWIIMPALISVSVELILFPILAYYFNMIPLVVVVANIFIVPLAGLSVVLACFTVFSAIFSFSVAGIFSASNWLCLDLTLRLTEFFASLPAAKLSISTPSTFAFLLYYLFLWMIVASLASRRKYLLFSVLIVANVFIWRLAFSRSDDPLKVTFLDVGQGSCAVVEAPNGENLIINAGERSENYDAGEYLVVPFLNHSGITEVDRLILTGTDASNFSSALSIAENRRIQTVFMPTGSDLADGQDDDSISRSLNQIVSLDSIGGITDQGARFGIHLLPYPKADLLGFRETSILVRVVYRDISFCLLDGMKKVRFCPEFDWDQLSGCSVLVLPELGDVTEIAKVITAVNPQRIIFTRHYFRYERDKIPLLMQLSFPEIGYHRTAEGGAVVCETDGTRIDIQPTLR